MEALWFRSLPDNSCDCMTPDGFLIEGRFVLLMRGGKESHENSC